MRSHTGDAELPSSIRVYDRIGFFYDAVMGPISRRARERAVATLMLEPGSRLLVLGIGSGLDLPHLPRDIEGLGIDLSEGMLGRALERRSALRMRRFELRKMDAQALDLPDASFDAVYLSLILAVASDGPQVLAEAARVAKPGARLVVADKFWPEGRARPALVRRASDLLGSLVTFIDRYFSEIHAGAPNLEILSDEPLALNGFFRLITLRKPR